MGKSKKSIFCNLTAETYSLNHDDQSSEMLVSNDDTNTLACLPALMNVFSATWNILRSIFDTDTILFVN